MSVSEPDKGGRPTIGPKVPINFPSSLLSRIDVLAADAGKSRAAWIRRAVADASIDSYERIIAPGEWGLFLTTFGRGRNEPGVRELAIRLHEGAAAGAIQQSVITINSRESATESTRSRAALVTRPMLIHGKPVTVYQVVRKSFSYADLTWEGHSNVSGWLFDNLELALEYYTDVAGDGIPGLPTVQSTLQEAPHGE